MSQLDLLPHSGPIKGRRPTESIVRTAALETVEPWLYRWIAHRAWGPGPTIFWALLNPSTADGRNDDPTMCRMMGFSYRWGFGSMIVGNIYPVVSSQPAVMRTWRATWDWKTYEANGMRPWDMDKTTWSAFHHNTAVLSKALGPEMKCVAAWGNGAPDADVDQFTRGVRIGYDDEEFGHIRIEVDWYCLRKTADGSPIHPLARGRNRVPDDAQLKLWKRAHDIHSQARRSPTRSSCI